MNLQNPGRRVVGPTQEDFEEFNEVLLGGEAQVRPRSDVSFDGAAETKARWGKGGGTMLPVLPDVLYRAAQLPLSLVLSSPSSEPYSPARVGEIVEVNEVACSSQNWDKDWWRLRRCLNCFEDTSYLLEEEELESDDASTVTCTFSEDASTCVDGDEDHVPRATTSDTNEFVYTPGELTGLWAGKLFVCFSYILYRPFADIHH